MGRRVPFPYAHMVRQAHHERDRSRIHHERDRSRIHHERDRSRIHYARGRSRIHHERDVSTAHPELVEGRERGRSRIHHARDVSTAHPRIKYGAGSEWAGFSAHPRIKTAQAPSGPVSPFIRSLSKDVSGMGRRVPFPSAHMVRQAHHERGVSTAHPELVEGRERGRSRIHHARGRSRIHHERDVSTDHPRIKYGAGSEWAGFSVHPELVEGREGSPRARDCRYNRGRLHRVVIGVPPGAGLPRHLV